MEAKWIKLSIFVIFLDVIGELFREGCESYSLFVLQQVKL